MADFKAHATASTLLGAAYGGAAHALWDLPPSTCFLAGGLCTLSGLLPDVDSNSSRPLREGLAFAAAFVPMMLVDRFQQLRMSPEGIVLAGAAVYVFVRFVLGELLRRYTVHRGMFHSLPAAVVFGELAFLLTSGPDLRPRFYKAGAVVLGYMTHLVLDEVYSFEWKRGRMRLKKSFGTAVKMFSRKWWPNVSAYGKLALLTYIVIYEPGWMAQVRDQRPLDWAQNWVEENKEKLADNPSGELVDPALPKESVRDAVGNLLPGLNRDSGESGSLVPLLDPTAPRTAERRDRYLE